MKKVRVDGVEGAVLDWLVAKAEGLLDQSIKVGEATATAVVIDEHGEMFDMRYGVDYSPSTNFSQEGPIRMREKLSVGPTCNGDWYANNPFACAPQMGYGPTPNIAAMRCFVMSRLGEEIEVPDVLVNR